MTPEPQPAKREVYLLKRSTGKHGSSLGKTTGWIHKASLIAKGVKMFSDVTYVRIDDVGFHIEMRGVQSILPVDHIVVCAGQEPSRSLFDELRTKGIYSHLIGGADEALELDAKRAIFQACHLAAVI